MGWPVIHKNKVYQSEVVQSDFVFFFVVLDQFENFENPHYQQPDSAQFGFRHFESAGDQFVGVCDVLGHSMPRTRDDVEQLGQGVYEIEYLRDEEEEEGFTEMAQYSDHCKRHAGEVAECVSDEYFCRVPVNFFNQRFDKIEIIQTYLPILLK